MYFGHRDSVGLSIGAFRGKRTAEPKDYFLTDAVTSLSQYTGTSFGLWLHFGQTEISHYSIGYVTEEMSYIVETIYKNTSKPKKYESLEGTARGWVLAYNHYGNNNLFCRGEFGVIGISTNHKIYEGKYQAFFRLGLGLDFFSGN